MGVPGRHGSDLGRDARQDSRQESRRGSRGASGRSMAAGARLAARLLLVACSVTAVAAPGAYGVAASAAWNGAPWPLEHVPVVLQSQPNSCGPAALATLTTWLGVPSTEADFLATARLGADGVSLEEFARLAEGAGLAGAWYRVPASELARLPVPYVAHLHAQEAEGSASAPAGDGEDLGHLVVVGASAHGYLVVGDPAVGAYVVAAAGLAQRFSGRVYLLRSAR